MDGKPALINFGVVGTVPPAVMADGAVAELTWHDDGTATAEVRIPGPPVP